jgi:hypothetical protein
MRNETSVTANAPALMNGLPEDSFSTRFRIAPFSPEKANARANGFMMLCNENLVLLSPAQNIRPSSKAGGPRCRIGSRELSPAPEYRLRLCLATRGAEPPRG